MIQPIRKIGNSSGVLLPKAMLKAAGIENEVEIEVQGQTILLRPANPRAGWAESFWKATEKDSPEGDLFEGMSNDFDQTEW